MDARDELNKFLLHRLPSLTQSDPVPLARYIEALVEKGAQPRQMLGELTDFLGKDTDAFVRELMHVKKKIENYDNGDSAEASRSPPRTSRFRSRSRSPHDSRPQRSHRGSYRDRDDFNGRHDRGRGRRDGRGRGGHMGQRGSSSGWKARFNKTLFIKRIPRELNSMKALVEHFEQFGEVTKVQVNPDRDNAVLEFQTHAQAEEALNSPKAIMDNRFITACWAMAPQDDIEKGIDPDLSEEKTAERHQAVKRQKTVAVLREKKSMLARLSAMKGENEAREKSIQELQTAITELEEQAALLGGISEQEHDAIKQAAIVPTVAALSTSPTKDAYPKRAPRSFMLDIADIPSKFHKKQLLQSHFQQFGKASVELGSEPDKAIVSFPTLRESKAALHRGMNLFGNILALSIREDDEDKPQEDE